MLSKVTIIHYFWRRSKICSFDCVTFLFNKININIKGPFPADTAFNKQNLKFYDVIVGMYHDQVLGPFKALYGYNAINLTLGLKYFRLSPDHGTAKDIVGKNKANPESLICAINFLSKVDD